MPQRGHAPRRYADKLTFAAESVARPDAERARGLKRTRRVRSKARGNRRARALPSTS